MRLSRALSLSQFHKSNMLSTTEQSHVSGHRSRRIPEEERNNQMYRNFFLPQRIISRAGFLVDCQSNINERGKQRRFRLELDYLI